MASLAESPLSVPRIPCAGTCMNRCFPGEMGENSWSQCGAESFQMRIGPKYDRNKKKGPSPPALMEIVGIE